MIGMTLNDRPLNRPSPGVKSHGGGLISLPNKIGLHFTLGFAAETEGFPKVENKSDPRHRPRDEGFAFT